MMTSAVFRHNPVEMFTNSIPKNLQNDILANGIPALSKPVGIDAVGTFVSATEDRNIDISTLKDVNNGGNGWPRSGGDYGDKWLHNDVRGT